MTHIIFLVTLGSAHKNLGPAENPEPAVDSCPFSSSSAGSGRELASADLPDGIHFFCSYCVNAITGNCIPEAPNSSLQSAETTDGTTVGKRKRGSRGGKKSKKKYNKKKGAIIF